MKKTIAILFASFLMIASISAKAQITKDACALISDGQINNIIGCSVKQSGPATLMGKHCTHKGADNKSEVVLEYYDWHDSKTAFYMLKTSYDENKNNISAGKKALAVYNSVTDFPDGGQYAYIATGNGSEMTNGNVVRIQFIIGTIIFTFDTKGIDKTKVIPKVKEIYNAIKANNT